MRAAGRCRGGRIRRNGRGLLPQRSRRKRDWPIQGRSHQTARTLKDDARLRAGNHALGRLVQSAPAFQLNRLHAVQTLETVAAICDTALMDPAIIAALLLRPSRGRKAKLHLFRRRYLSGKLQRQTIQFAGG